MSGSGQSTSNCVRSGVSYIADLLDKRHAFKKRDESSDHDGSTMMGETMNRHMLPSEAKSVFSLGKTHTGSFLTGHP